MANDITYDDIINKDIFELMGVGDMPEERKRDLYTKILETIQNRTIARIADNLTDKDAEEWLQIKETGDKQKMQEFMQGKGIDINQIMLQEALIYKTELTEIAKPLRDARNNSKE